ncbi:MAG: hypothetical protein ABFD07_02185 [Methanobacterium sp.]
MKKKYKVVIDRSKWRTGSNGDNATGKGNTFLLNKEGFKCCLGFITQQITKKGVLNLSEPNECEFSVPFLNKITEEEFYEPFYCNTELSDMAIGINDSSNTTMKEKEKQLKELFKNTPISLTFKGKAVPYNE